MEPSTELERIDWQIAGYDKQLATRCSRRWLMGYAGFNLLLNGLVQWGVTSLIDGSPIVAIIITVVMTIVVTTPRVFVRRRVMKQRQVLIARRLRAIERMSAPLPTMKERYKLCRQDYQAAIEETGSTVLKTAEFFDSHPEMAAEVRAYAEQLDTDEHRLHGTHEATEMIHQAMDGKIRAALWIDLELARAAMRDREKDQEFYRDRIKTWTDM